MTGQGLNNPRLNAQLPGVAVSTDCKDVVELAIIVQSFWTVEQVVVEKDSMEFYFDG